jgi:hypothetical protein
MDEQIEISLNKLFLSQYHELQLQKRFSMRLLLGWVDQRECKQVLAQIGSAQFPGREDNPSVYRENSASCYITCANSLTKAGANEGLNWCSRRVGSCGSRSQRYESKGENWSSLSRSTARWRRINSRKLHLVPNVSFLNLAAITLCFCGLC